MNDLWSPSFLANPTSCGAASGGIERRWSCKKADRKSKSQDVTLKLESVGITKDAILTLADKSRLFAMPPMLSSPKSCDTMSVALGVAE
jgi:hypothetical protein